MPLSAKCASEHLPYQASLNESRSQVFSPILAAGKLPVSLLSCLFLSDELFWLNAPGLIESCNKNYNFRGIYDSRVAMEDNGKGIWEMVAG